MKSQVPRRSRALVAALALALLIALVSGDMLPGSRAEPTAAVEPLGACIPGTPATTVEPTNPATDTTKSAKTSASARKTPNGGVKAVFAAHTGLERRLADEGAEVAVPSDALDEPTEIGIEPLNGGQLPGLGSGMDNMTEGPDGFRFTPTPHTFDADLTVTLPYDPQALADNGLTTDDLRTFYFDEPASCWRALERISVDEVNHLVVSRTDHFTDMVNATVNAPDGPGQVSFDPTQIKGLQAAAPGTGVNQVSVPQASGDGAAHMSFPIELPKGRGSLQPSLSVGYNSSTAQGAAGWAGAGWDVAVPSVTVDTRWGVPRYDTDRETETYTLSGTELTPLARGADPAPRTADKVFHPRIEGAFDRIVRKGDSPKNYAWDVTDKSGVTFHYGGEGATLADDAGHIFQWSLREITDPHGNTVRYHYETVDDAGVAGSSVTGRNLYPKTIAYTGRGDTDGPYTVTFTRDRELHEARRPDVSIDARGGFKRVTADLLRRIEVKFQDRPVRSYELSYTTGAFNKSLLAGIEQFDADGKSFDRQTFDYYDDIRDASGQYDAFKKVGWNSPDDDVRSGIVDGVKPGSGEAGTINGNSTRTIGGHLYVGYNPTGPSKSNSYGVKAGYANTQGEGLLALVDVDADGLPDKVFKDGGGYVFRKNLSKPGGEPRFSDDTTPLKNLPGIMESSDDSLTVGVEGYPGAVALQLDYVDSFSTTTRYFTDVNADGVIDLVDGTSVLFGRVGEDGTVVYGAASDTPAPIGQGKVGKDGLLPDYSQDADRRIDSFPLVDSVRRWTAPYAGTVQVTGDVTLRAPQQDQGQSRNADPDGVRVAVQLEDQELWSRRIPADDHGGHAPENVDAVHVNRGDHLYFRVGSVFDGAGDTVDWDPVVRYDGIDPASTDANGLPLGTYTASKDFTLAGRQGTVPAPKDGTLHLGGDVVKKAATTDDLTVVITRSDDSGSDTVFSKTIGAADTGRTPVDLDVPVSKGDKLSWRINTDSPVDVDAVEWTPVAAYAGAPGPDGPASDDPTYAQAFSPPYDIDTYSPAGADAPAAPWTVSGDGTYTVTPHITVQPNTTGRAVFTVKKHGALLGKRVIDLATLDPDDPPSVEVEAEDGDQLYLDLSVPDPKVAPRLGDVSATIGGGTEEAAVTVQAAEAEGVFGRSYRGWSYVGWNGNRDRADKPLDQSVLESEDALKADLPDQVDPEADKDAFSKDPRIQVPRVVPYAPRPDQGNWGSGEYTWIKGGTVSSSRLGGQSVQLPSASGVSGGQAVPRIARSQQVSLTAGVGGPIGSVGGSVATGTSTGELDFLDMNGDAYPDVVGSGDIQYTGPDGVLGATRGAVPGGDVRKSDTLSGNASAGSAARTISTGRGDAAPTGDRTSNTSSSGNDMPPFGIGGNLGAGKSDSSADLLDINGDGLPDRVHEDGRVELNLGYRFGPAEQWPGAGALNAGSSTNGGLNIGFSTDFYGFAGGASFDQSSSTTKETLTDVNGDGLADRVTAGDPIKVALNTGSGFADPVPFNGSLDGLTADSNAKLGGGAYVTVPICWIAGCLILNPGANVSTGASRAQQVLRDIDGDGLADHLASGKDNELTVARNETGRTNLLKSAHRPMGSRIDLEYTRDGNTYDQPGSRWVMSRTAVTDGLTGDGPDAQVSTFRYSGGVWDRQEREFRGYGSVATEQRDGDGALYRTTTRDFRTDSYYTKGLIAREAVADGAGHLYTEKLNTYSLRDVSTGASGNAASTTATLFPQLTKTQSLWYEGQAEPGKQTSTDLAYDDVGNVVRTVDHGDADPGDDTTTVTTYTDCADTHILGIPQAVQVRGPDNAVLRSADSDVDCATGDVTRTRNLLADGTSADTDVAYNDDGSLRSVTSPPNERGQRYRLEYTYDKPTGTYVTATVDSFGYRSASTYDLRFGLPEETTDINGQKLTTSYDTLGRPLSITGPLDRTAGRPTIAYEYHPEAAVPYAVTRHLDRNADGTLRDDTIDTVTFADGLGRIVQTKKDATIDGADMMTVSGRIVFDALGRAVSQYYPTSEPKGAGNTEFAPAFDTVRPTTTAYDVMDRPLRTAMPDGTATRESYGFGNDRDGTRQFETVTVDAKNIATSTFTDVRQRTTAVEQPGAKSGDAPIWTSYLYDPLDQVTKVLDDRNNATTAAYDLLGRRTRVTSPDGGTTSTVYDLAGNTTRTVTANLAAHDQAVTYTYDFNRVTDINHPVFTGNDVHYTYGGPDAPDNAAGRVTKVTDAGGETLRKYDALGEVAEETTTLPAPGPNTRTFTTKYSYDSFGRVLQLTYPDNEVLSYTYDSGGRVKAASGVKNGFTYTYLKRLDYDKFEQRAYMELGNGTSTRYTYGAEDRRLAAQKSQLPTGYTFQNLAYTYDDAGNVTRQTNATTPPTSADTPKLGGPSQQSYSYDNLYRLTSASGSYSYQAGKTDHYTYSTAYDTLGNITLKDQQHSITVGSGNEQGQQNTTYRNTYAYGGTRPHAPSVVGPDTLSYDANGNEIDSVSSDPGNPRRQQVWDEENRLACVLDTSKNQAPVAQEPATCDQPGKPPTVRFLYDDQGNRVVKDGSQTTLYPNQNYTARGQTEFKHVFADGVRIATQTSKSGTAYEKDQFFYHGDSLGSTSFGTDANGQLAEYLNYFPSGETWVDERPSQRTPYQFTGKEQDPETGYTYAGARYYSPRSGQWQSPDPAMSGYLDGAPNGGVYTPSNLGSYSYGNNNPVNYLDPTGQAWSASDIAWGFAKGAAVAVVAAAVVTVAVVALPVVAAAGATAVAGAAVGAAVGTATSTAVSVAVTAATVYGAAQTYKQAHSVYTGKDWDTGRQLTDKERSEGAGELAGGLVGAAVGGYAGGKIGGAVVGAVESRAGAAVARPCNSFTPDTEVVLADGTAKPIDEVRLGDLVLSTDPVTDRTKGEPVAGVITGKGEKNLVKVTVDTDGPAGNRTASVTATDEHPFWSENLHAWQYAKDLRPGTWLRTSADTVVKVTAVKAWTAGHQKVQNLSVTELHTYYVLVGGKPVLVHNAGCSTSVSGKPQEQAIAKATGVSRNAGPGQQKITGTQTGKDRIPDFNVKESVAKRGTMLESKDVANLEYRGQIRDFEAHANDVLGVPLEIVVRPGTGTTVPTSGGLHEAIQLGRIIVTPLDKL